MGNRHNEAVIYINPSNSPYLHLQKIVREDDKTVEWKYIPSLMPELTLRLASVNGAIKPFMEINPLEATIIQLLPPITNKPDSEKPVPQYKTTSRAEQVISEELFTKGKGWYLPQMLLKHPFANLLTIVHGVKWCPVVEEVIRKKLHDAGYGTNANNYFLSGRKRILMHGILIDR